MNKAVTVLRWVAVLPAWLVTSMLAGVVFMLVQWVGGHMLDATAESAYFAGFLVVLRAVFCSVIGMAAVAYVAPSAKRESAFVVASMLATVTVILLAMLCMQWNGGTISGSKLIWVALDGVPAAIAGFVVASRIPQGCGDADIRSGDWLME